MSTSAADHSTERGSVLDRLVRTADLALQRDGIDGVSIDGVAAEAGVSRATAFRHLGKRDQMIVAVALLRSRRFASECTVQMSRHVSAFAKLEAAFIYLVRELPNDPVVRELFAMRSPDDLGPGTHEQAVATLGPVVESGRAAGEIRTDISVDQIIDWTVEQLYLAVQQADRSEAAVIYRLRTFLAPALGAGPGHVVSGTVRSRIETLESAVQQTVQALAALRGELPRATDDS
jgi:AcrR family transcriptional regulator